MPKMDTFTAISTAGNLLRFAFREDAITYITTGALTDLEGETIEQIHGCDCDGATDGYGACSIPECLMQQDATHRYWTGRRAA